ncbi:MAG: GntR family transcriptional regulator [Verrucomicrobiia bacterium]|jgi:DNA-binding GntR family transcriptional regulator
MPQSLTAKASESLSAGPNEDGATESATSMVDDVYNAILLRIVRGELPSGSLLKSTTLAAQLGVSRTPVVQALARLTADGIIAQERNRRARVRRGAENWLVELHEMRILLEPHAAAMAATQITDEALSDLEALVDAARPNDGTTWIEAAKALDYGLHQIIADNCGSLPIRQTIKKCWSYKSLSYDFGGDSPEGLKQGYQDHLAITESLKARDPQAASAAMLLHLHNAKRLRVANRIV